MARIASEALVQRLADSDPWQHVAPASAPKTAAVYLQPPGTPSAEDLRRLADFLNDGRKTAILAGAGALHAREELLATAIRSHRST